MEELKNTIIGYSERGIMNSLMFSIYNDLDEVRRFLEFLTGDSIAIKNYEIYLEHSLSDYGTPDTVIITDERIYFIEYKVVARNPNWSLRKEYDNFQGMPKKRTSETSNVFYQLYLKEELINRIREDHISLNDDKGWSDPKSNRVNYRKIGSHELVHFLFRKIQNTIKLGQKKQEVVFIGIVPECNNSIKTEPNLLKGTISSNNYKFIEWEKVRAYYNNVSIIENTFAYNQQEFLEKDKRKPQIYNE